MSCRSKVVFGPTGTNGLENFFESITLKAASRIGMPYRFLKMQSTTGET